MPSEASDSAVSVRPEMTDNTIFMPAISPPNPLVSSQITISGEEREHRSHGSDRKSVSFSNLIKKFRARPVVARAHFLSDVVNNEQKEEGLVVSLSAFQKKNLELVDVMDDAKLHILSFLSATDVRSVSATCQELHHLIFSTQARCLWMDLCRKQWHWLSVLRQTETKLACHDDRSISTAKTDMDNEERDESFDANLSLLLAMSAKSQPLQLSAPTYFYPSSRRTNGRPRSRLLLRVPGFRTFEMSRPSTKQSSESQLGSPTGGREPSAVRVIQFIGPVGNGNRCVRADRPLPRVASHHCQSHNRNRSRMPTFLCRGGVSSSYLRPFVSPYVVSSMTTKGFNGSNVSALEIDLNPRLVSYFEVTIMERDEKKEPSLPRGRRHDWNPDANRMLQSSTGGDCIAVGLSAKSFQVHTKMPGWDSVSFGYHGDDGGIFHNTGDKIRRFGPSYGPGDTVGCGIDYESRGIFFTINGRFLGYAWRGLGDDIIMNDLYPTVGIDSNWPVAWNFGNQPFAFNLSSFNKQHRPVIEASLSHLGAASIFCTISARS